MLSQEAALVIALFKDELSAQWMHSAAIAINSVLGRKQWNEDSQDWSFLLFALEGTTIRNVMNKDNSGRILDQRSNLYFRLHLVRKFLEFIFVLFSRVIDFPMTLFLNFTLFSLYLVTV